MNKQMINPYLPSWEYIPDGEPYAFGDRVYVYGSHDRFNGHAYCLNDYVCWSAPADDMGNWRYEGVIYRKTQDPVNRDGRMCLYAPDVAKGTDGRYYLYYVLDQINIVSVAVCDTPAGEYTFYGYVHYNDGTRLGEREGDEPQFDPGVLCEGDRTYLYTGFCYPHDRTRHGAMATVLGPDMLTVTAAPGFVIPSRQYAAGSGFEGHEYFEAPSIRKYNGMYYLIYSSILQYELCYAVSPDPVSGFRYGGVIISNNDIGIDSYKPAGMPAYYGGNNHGSIEKVGDDWWIFYHRHTNGTNFSRQGCIERIYFDENGMIPQVSMTSCAGGTPITGKGVHPAYTACSLFCRTESVYTGMPGEWLDCRFPKITQDGKDGDEEEGYIANMRDGAVAGFRYLDCREVKNAGIAVRGYINGTFLIKTEWDGDVLARIPVVSSTVWVDYDTEISIPDGVCAIYIEYSGEGGASLRSFRLS